MPTARGSTPVTQLRNRQRHDEWIVAYCNSDHARNCKSMAAGMFKRNGFADITGAVDEVWFHLIRQLLRLDRSNYPTEDDYLNVLRKIAKNKAIDIIDRFKVRRATEDTVQLSETIAAVYPDPANDIDVWDSRNTVNTFLDRLAHLYAAKSKNNGADVKIWWSINADAVLADEEERSIQELCTQYGLTERDIKNAVRRVKTFIERHFHRSFADLFGTLSIPRKSSMKHQKRSRD